MATPYHLVPILLLLVAGCEQPAGTVPPTPPAATKPTQPTVEPVTPQTPSDATADANEITGKVIGSSAGDTIDILRADKTKIRIRLNGIDAAEEGQPFREECQTVSQRIHRRPDGQSRDAWRGSVRTDYWLNTSSNVGHNSSCKWFKNTKSGRSCGANDGKGCGICGG
ncbi:MAG: hypothetical protein WCO86_10165 [Planctomycetota bacterium]